MKYDEYPIELKFLVRLTHKMIDDYKESKEICIYEFSCSWREELEKLKLECDRLHTRTDYFAGEIGKLVKR